jgi:hypothetical protein
MKLLPTIEVATFLTEQEVDQLVELIYAQSSARSDLGNYKDSGKDGKYGSKKIAVWHDTDIDSLHQVTNIMLPKLAQALGYQPIIEDLHILESSIPYMIHNDFITNHNLTAHPPEWFNSHSPEYTIIIPIETYDSVTVIFNEAHEINDFEQFKKEYPGDLSIKLDKQFILNNLTHLYPKDLRYLTLKSTHNWDKGKMFAVDRRYYHCSDNFIKKDIVHKKAIIIRTVRKI